MIKDKLLEMSNAQAVTATAASTSYIDQLAASDALNPGSWVEFLIRTGYTSNSATVTFAVQSDSDSGFATTLLTHFSTAALADTVLLAGYRIRVKLPPGTQRYIRAYYTVTGTGVAGTIDANIVNDIDVVLA